MEVETVKSMGEELHEIITREYFEKKEDIEVWRMEDGEGELTRGIQEVYSEPIIISAINLKDLVYM